MPEKYKTTQLDNGDFLIKETIDGKPHNMRINRKALQISIQALKQEVADKQELLVYKKGLLKEINKVE